MSTTKNVPQDAMNTQVQAPSHDQDFIDSITGVVSPQARRRLAARTRRALAQVDLIPAQSLHDSPAAYDADNLRKDITRALAYIDVDDLFALACLCDRFALCPAGDREVAH